jgi:S1-C subfamily serine protease
VWSKVRKEFDSRGRVVRLKLQGEDENKKVVPARDADGVSEIEYCYGRLAYPTGQRYFDIKREPIPVEVFIAKVDAGAGEKAGLKQDDVLVRYDGKPVPDLYEFAMWRQSEPEESVKELVVRREGKEVAIRIKGGKLDIAFGDRFLKNASTSTVPATQNQK